MNKHRLNSLLMNPNNTLQIKKKCEAEIPGEAHFGDQIKYLEGVQRESNNPILPPHYHYRPAQTSAGENVHCKLATVVLFLVQFGPIFGTMCLMPLMPSCYSIKSSSWCNSRGFWWRDSSLFVMNPIRSCHKVYHYYYYITWSSVIQHLD